MAHCNITVNQVGKLPVWHVSSRDTVTLAMTFIRMQEWYESPNKDFFRSTFTLKQYKEWYAENHGGKFSYAEDWSGFNVPSTAVRAVYENFPEHSKEERALFRILRKTGVLDENRFYLIGSMPGAASVHAHELRHALYFVSSKYRRKTDVVLKKFPVRSLRNELKRKGYATAVIPDEVQAYALTGFPDGMKVTREMRRLRIALSTVEQEFLSLLPPE